MMAEFEVVVRGLRVGLSVLLGQFAGSGRVAE